MEWFLGHKLPTTAVLDTICLGMQHVHVKQMEDGLEASQHAKVINICTTFFFIANFSKEAVTLYLDLPLFVLQWNMNCMRTNGCTVDSQCNNHSYIPQYAVYHNICDLIVVNWGIIRQMVIVLWNVSPMKKSSNLICELNKFLMQPSDVVGWATLTRVMSVLVMESLVS